MNPICSTFSPDLTSPSSVVHPLVCAEDALFERWRASYSPAEQEEFCADGLCTGRRLGARTPAVWEAAARRVLFLMKDTNDNPGEDIRDWPLCDTLLPDGEQESVHRFFVVVLKWLWALHEVGANCLPRFTLRREEYVEATEAHPMAFVNVKKLSGGASVSNAQLQHYMERDLSYLREQVCDILRPNIIVCGGASSLLKDFVVQQLYASRAFERINDWCYLSLQPSPLLVVDAYHPAHRISDAEKFDEMIEQVQQVFLLHPTLFAE